MQYKYHCPSCVLGARNDINGTHAISRLENDLTPVPTFSFSYFNVDTCARTCICVHRRAGVNAEITRQAIKQVFSTLNVRGTSHHRLCTD